MIQLDAEYLIWLKRLLLYPGIFLAFGLFSLRLTWLS